jgi:hypothetical protein
VTISPDGFFELDEEVRVSVRVVSFFVSSSLCFSLSLFLSPSLLLLTFFVSLSLSLQEDPPVCKEAEAEALSERFPKPAAEMKDSEAWKHHEVELNILGRARAMPEQLDANGDVSLTLSVSLSLSLPL